MSTKHLFPDLGGLVNKALRGLVSYNPSLNFDETNRIIYDTKFNKDTVAIISGGGSGHEPAWAGYVGENMMASAVQGDIFASPSTKQVMAAINAVPSNKGTILVITNYTGDCLHFGLAEQKAIAQGHNCKMIICGDDVSIGKTGSKVGRRGLAGQQAVLKIMGGASGAGGSLDDVYGIGVAVQDQIVSIAASLDHCHVPGRAFDPSHMLADNVIELGTGPHNETGRFKMSPQPTPENFIKEMLTYCLKPDDPIRSYVKFNPGDETMLLVSNFGGMSHLEMGAVVDELLVQLERDWNLAPCRIANGFLETSLNAPAFSISVVNMTAAANDPRCPYTVEQIKEFFDVRTNTAWEGMAGSQAIRRPRAEQFVPPPAEPHRTIDPAKDLRIDPALLKHMVESACKELARREPDLTKWDTIMGDGDCGETLKSGANYLLDAVNAGCTKDGSVIAVLHELEDIVEGKLGGTLGGILGIYFVGLRNALEENISLKDSAGIPALWAKSVFDAKDALRRYTPAQVGDRTVMDTLITFAESFQGGDFNKAVEGALAGAKNTENLKPQLGRATYVGGGDDISKGVPDPGAMGAAIVIEALLKSIS